MKVKRLGSIVLAGVAIGAMSSSVLSQSYPAKAVRVIVPFPPGGSVDVIARLVTPYLAAPLGQQVFVENRSGAGGTIGTEAGVKASPDGYTLTMVSSSYAIHPSLYKLPFDPVNDIAPVVLVATTPFVICIHPSLPVHSVKELIALARSRPGEITFATAGTGSAAHMATELFLWKAGIVMNHVPYKGVGPALTDLMAGHIALAFSSAAGAFPYVRANRLRALAVTSVQRFPSEPSIPTLVESGVPGFEVLDWGGLLGPRGTPRAVIERINDETNKVLKRKDVAERFEQMGLNAGGGDPDQFLERIRRERETWSQVVTKAKIAVN